jgi:hypothetical protein
MPKSTVQDVESPTRPTFDQATYDQMIAGLVEGQLDDAVTNLQTKCLTSYLFDEALAYLRDSAGGQ